MAPRVSVVIPMYNAAKYLAAAVESVIAQTFDDWELVLSDDGSRDNTLAVAYEHARRNPSIRVVEGVNGGAGRARNRGAAATNPGSEFITFLDSDDVWEPYALAVLTQALEQYPSAPAAHGRPRAVDPLGRPFPDDVLPHRSRCEVWNGSLRELPPGAPTTFECLLVDNYPVTPGTMLIRRPVWETLGGYAPDTPPCEDWDFNLRLARGGAIVLVDQVVLNWRRHPEAISLNSRRWRKAYLLVRKRTVQSGENTASQRAAALSAFRLSCRDGWANFGRQLVGGRLATSISAFARALTYQAAYWQAQHSART